MKTMDRSFRPHRRTRFHTNLKCKPLFYRTLAMYTGYCGICGTSYQPGEAIYHCRKTETTRKMRCHEACYLHKTGAFAPSNKPSPPESEVRQQREAS
jgi:hypothetical protein